MEDNHLTMADGTVIDMLTGEPVRKVDPIEVPTNTQAVREITRRRLHDLPDPTQRMNAISLVAAYHMYGLSSGDIAEIAGLSVEQVDNIKSLDAFTKMVDAIGDNIVDAEAADVRTILAQKSVAALNKVISHVDSADSKVSLAAAKDVLDRAGHRPSDIVEHRHSMEGGLRIEYIKRDTTDNVPAVDVSDYHEVDDDA